MPGSPNAWAYKKSLNDLCGQKNPALCRNLGGGTKKPETRKRYFVWNSARGLGGMTLTTRVKSSHYPEEGQLRWCGCEWRGKEKRMKSSLVNRLKDPTQVNLKGGNERWDTVSYFRKKCEEYALG